MWGLAQLAGERSAVVAAAGSAGKQFAILFFRILDQDIRCGWYELQHTFPIRVERLAVDEGTVRLIFSATLHGALVAIEEVQAQRELNCRIGGALDRQPVDGRILAAIDRARFDSLCVSAFDGGDLTRGLLLGNAVVARETNQRGRKSQ